MPEIKTSVTTLKDNKVQLDVEVPKDEVAARIDHTISHLAHDVNIPGFRKGKVPRSVLISRFGKETILTQTLNDALPMWYEAAVADSGIKPVDNPELDFEGLEDNDASFSFKATVPVRPRPSLPRYAGIEVEKEVVEVSDAEVEEPIERLRKCTASLEPVEGRPAARGDFVVIDFTGHIDDEPIEGGAGKDHMLELGSSSFIPGFEDQIEGMEKGRSKKLKLTFPEDYQPEKLAGQEAVFDVTLKEIKERNLPETNDEFASEASEFDTIEELRSDIRSRMTKAREDAAERLFEEQVLEKVVTETEVEMPPVMLDRRTEQIRADFIATLKDNGLSWESYIEQAGASPEELEENFKMRAEQTLKQEMVLDAVAEIEEIEIGEEEIDEEMRSGAKAMGHDPDELVKKMRAAGRQSVVRESLKRRQAMKAMAGKAIPVLKKGGPAGTAAGAAQEEGIATVDEAKLKSAAGEGGKTGATDEKS